LSKRGVASSVIIISKEDIILAAGVMRGNILTMPDFDFDPILKFKTCQEFSANDNGGKDRVIF